MAHDLVVGVDSSDTSRHAVEYACSLVTGGSFERPLLVHVIPWSPYSFTTPEENEQRSVRKKMEIEAARSQVLDPLTRFAAECGVEVETFLQHGDRVDTLLRIAEENQTRHIVVGRTGDSGLRERLFGTLPSALVRLAPVPVTVVPGPGNAPA
jgi:nucleotide-binding universal stress UspA family protein